MRAAQEAVIAGFRAQQAGDVARSAVLAEALSQGKSYVEAVALGEVAAKAARAKAAKAVSDTVDVGDLGGGDAEGEGGEAGEATEATSTWVTPAAQSGRGGGFAGAGTGAATAKSQASLRSVLRMLDLVHAHNTALLRASSPGRPPSPTPKGPASGKESGREGDVFLDDDVASDVGLVTETIMVAMADRLAMTALSKHKPHNGVILDTAPITLPSITELTQSDVAPRLALDATTDAGAVAPAVWVVLDGVQDPNNLGAVLRSAAFYGVRGVVIGGRGGVSSSMTSAVAKVSSGALDCLAIYAAGNLRDFLVRSKQFLAGPAEAFRVPSSCLASPAAARASSGAAEEGAKDGAAIRRGVKPYGNVRIVGLSSTSPLSLPLAALSQPSVRVNPVAGVAEGNSALDEREAPCATILVVGSEDAGISPGVLRECHILTSIGPVVAPPASCPVSPSDPSRHAAEAGSSSVARASESSMTALDILAVSQVAPLIDSLNLSAAVTVALHELLSSRGAGK